MSCVTLGLLSGYYIPYAGEQPKRLHTTLSSFFHLRDVRFQGISKVLLGSLPGSWNEPVWVALKLKLHKFHGKLAPDYVLYRKANNVLIKCDLRREDANLIMFQTNKRTQKSHDTRDVRGRAMAQAVRCLLFTTEAYVWSQASPHKICGGHWGNLFSPKYCGFPLWLSFHQCYILFQISATLQS
jgi:hypothetical protein